MAVGAEVSTLDYRAMEGAEKGPAGGRASHCSLFPFGFHWSGNLLIFRSIRTVQALLKSSWSRVEF